MTTPTERMTPTSSSGWKLKKSIALGLFWVLNARTAIKAK